METLKRGYCIRACTQAINVVFLYMYSYYVFNHIIAGHPLLWGRRARSRAHFCNEAMKPQHKMCILKALAPSGWRSVKEGEAHVLQKHNYYQHSTLLCFLFNCHIVTHHDEACGVWLVPGMIAPVRRPEQTKLCSWV